MDATHHFRALEARAAPATRAGLVPLVTGLRLRVGVSRGLGLLHTDPQVGDPGTEERYVIVDHWLDCLNDVSALVRRPSRWPRSSHAPKICASSAVPKVARMSAADAQPCLDRAVVQPIRPIKGPHLRVDGPCLGAVAASAADATVPPPGSTLCSYT